MLLASSEREQSGIVELSEEGREKKTGWVMSTNYRGAGDHEDDDACFCARNATTTIATYYVRAAFRKIFEVRKSLGKQARRRLLFSLLSSSDKISSEKFADLPGFVATLRRRNVSKRSGEID